MKILILSLFVGIWPGPDADTLSLVYCYEQILRDHPLARQVDLQQEITDLRVRLANTGYFPRLEVAGTAGYQSEVTSLPSGPGGTALAKDQYKVSLELTQPVYNGGATEIRKNMEQERGRQEQLSMEVQLHELRSQIDEVYFNILLARQQGKTVALLREDLESKLEMVKVQVNNGVLLPGHQYIIQAELLKTRQDSLETISVIRAGLRVLGELIDREIPSHAMLELPDISYEEILKTDPKRPEVWLLESRKNILEFRKELVNSKRHPSVSAFGSLAYGRPGYDILNNDFHEFYRVGARVRWDFWDWNNSSREEKVLSLQQQKVEEERLVFNRQMDSVLDRLDERIASLREQIQTDEEIIELRRKIVKESESQLKNGVLTAIEYVTELNRAAQARLAQFVHRVQLTRMIMQYATTKGVSVSRLKKSLKIHREER